MKISEIVRYPEKIPCDKRLHYMIGVILIAITLIATTSIVILSVILVIVAYGIEYIQKWTKSGQFDHHDALAVIIGGITVLSPLIVIGVIN